MREWSFDSENSGFLGGAMVDGTQRQVKKCTSQQRPVIILHPECSPNNGMMRVTTQITSGWYWFQAMGNQVISLITCLFHVWFTGNPSLEGYTTGGLVSLLGSNKTMSPGHVLWKPHSLMMDHTCCSVGRFVGFNNLWAAGHDCLSSVGWHVDMRRIPWDPLGHPHCLHCLISPVRLRVTVTRIVHKVSTKNLLYTVVSHCHYNIPRISKVF